MTKFLLSVHVLAAILVVGPISVAASLFPRYAGRLPPRGGGGSPDGRAHGVAAFLHRICRGYAVAGVVVPVFGIATGARLGVLTDAWLLASVVLTAGAAALLVLAILPDQRRMLGGTAEETAETVGAGAETRAGSRAGAEAGTRAGAGADVGAGADGRHPLAARLTGLTGVFNLLWAVVVVLMIVRPGSTTGA
ncbi:hypothetical protein [Streptomyces sp. NPDC047928]|uniref:hypothetical protein n=1 Tax=unclassified Streptomyces TaxID=2593676 RepID=UPI00370FE695